LGEIEPDGDAADYLGQDEDGSTYILRTGKKHRKFAVASSSTFDDSDFHDEVERRFASGPEDRARSSGQLHGIVYESAVPQPAPVASAKPAVVESGAPARDDRIAKVNVRLDGLTSELAKVIKFLNDKKETPIPKAPKKRGKAVKETAAPAPAAPPAAIPAVVGVTSISANVQGNGRGPGSR